MSSDDLPYGELVICLDEKSPWYLQVGKIRGKNEKNVGVAYADDPKDPATGRWHPKIKVRPAAEVAAGASPYLRGLRIRNGRLAREITIDTGESPPPTHILLTGPNGSGKTSILEALAAVLGSGPPDTGVDPPIVEPISISSPASVAAARALQTAFVGVFLPAERSFRPAPVVGPSALEWPTLLATAPAATSFSQYLVNRRAQQAIAREEGRTAEADAIAGELVLFTGAVRKIFHDPEVAFHLDRGGFDVQFTLGTGRTVGLSQLPAGWAAVLSLWAELSLREEAWRRVTGNEGRPLGVAIIDEIETHLHLRMQEAVLPLLTAYFPNWQFIVATHAPVVLTSIPNAIVCDLERGDTIRTAELRGVKYGTLMTSHFGLDDEYDAATTLELEELRRLAETSRDARSEDRFRELADQLTRRSPTLAREVWLARRAFGAPGD